MVCEDRAVFLCQFKNSSYLRSIELITIKLYDYENNYEDNDDYSAADSSADSKCAG